MKRLIFALIVALAMPATAAALDTEDVLSLVAMPLAVAAVADLVGVPEASLISVVTALNQAEVPPPQFIEVVRFVPFVLVDEEVAPQFVSFVTTQVQQGVVRDALAVAIAQQLRERGVREINVETPPRIVIVERDQIIPPTVVTRVAEVRQHPHGGPPGQVKKTLGVQTGAEVVHGTKPGRDHRPIVAGREDDDDDRGRRGRGVRGKDRDPRETPAVIVKSEGGSGKKGRGDPPGGMKDNSGKGKSQGKGKGKGR